jgi:hypothetical protein
MHRGIWFVLAVAGTLSVAGAIAPAAADTCTCSQQTDGTYFCTCVDERGNRYCVSCTSQDAKSCTKVKCSDN